MLTAFLFGFDRLSGGSSESIIVLFIRGDRTARGPPAVTERVAQRCTPGHESPAGPVAGLLASGSVLAEQATVISSDSGPGVQTGHPVFPHGIFRLPGTVRMPGCNRNWREHTDAYRYNRSDTGTRRDEAFFSASQSDSRSCDTGTPPGWRRVGWAQSPVPAIEQVTLTGESTVQLTYSPAQAYSTEFIGQTTRRRPIACGIGRTLRAPSDWRLWSHPLSREGDSMTWIPDSVMVRDTVCDYNCRTVQIARNITIHNE